MLKMALLCLLMQKYLKIKRLSLEMTAVGLVVILAQ